MAPKSGKWRTLLRRWAGADEGREIATDVQPEAVAPLLCRRGRSCGEPVLAVFSTLEQAEEARWRADRFEKILGDGRGVGVLTECLSGGRFVPENEARRARVLSEVMSDPPAIVTTSVGALLSPAPDPDDFRRGSIRLRPGAAVTRDDLLRRLVELDYDDEVEVTAPGEFAWRGGVVDVFSPGSDLPVRLEFFGEEVDSLRLFSPATQRSVRTIEEFEIIPRLGMDEAARRSDGLAYFSPEGWATVLVFPERIDAHLERFFEEERAERWRRWLSLRPRETTWRLLDPVESTDVDRELNASPCFPGTTHLIESLPGDASAENESRFQRLFAEQTRQWIDLGRHVAFVSEDPAALPHLEAWCEEFDVPLDQLELDVGELTDGLVFPGENLVVLPEKSVHAVFHRSKRPVKADSPFASDGESREGEEDVEFQEGDRVVHAFHGVGIYHGIGVVKRGGVEREMMHLEYADEVFIHAPLHHAHLIGRYVGAGRSLPALSKIDGRRWRSAKLAAAGSANLLASEMLRLQAARAANRGFAFPDDDPGQIAFERAFPHGETPDQIKASAEVRDDMISPTPMDRLLCGDVGYGKTEVAMRAVFRAVMAGKQVAVLVPTTILAQQHYYTFGERFAAHPVIIDTLSRFKRRSEQNATLRRLAEGTIDVVIGTHRLVQSDVRFRDLGLVIIDEEQRFGVEHKERLKRLRLNIDVLTMTATPIPRTLHLSLAGIRNLSTIMTPPSRRAPVRTVVGQHESGVVKAAIESELGRGGQVFYLHNRVKTIDKALKSLESLVPDATFAVTHGQMDERELESRMAAFIEGSIDVLVTTTIIESGLDIANANTIIIERADRFGLAELHQLRGRVGRWNRQAHAYLLLPRRGIITGDARERVAAIRKYTRLGIGLKLAIKDLEIRGAGSLLGREQSGHINLIGFDLYCRLLKSAAARLKGDSDPILPEVDLNLDFLEFAINAPDGKAIAAIPPSYVPSSSSRVALHRRLAVISDVDQVDAFQEELRDRFGPVPESAVNLLNVRKLMIAAARAGLTAVVVSGDRIKLETPRGPSRRSGGQTRIKGKYPQRKILDVLDVVTKKNKIAQKF